LRKVDVTHILFILFLTINSARYYFSTAPGDCAVLAARVGFGDAVLCTLEGRRQRDDAEEGPVDIDRPRLARQDGLSARLALGHSALSSTEWLVAYKHMKLA
jgi:hypothetical protein